MEVAGVSIGFWNKGKLVKFGLGNICEVVMVVVVVGAVVVDGSLTAVFCISLLNKFGSLFVVSLADDDIKSNGLVNGLVELENNPDVVVVDDDATDCGGFIIAGLNIGAWRLNIDVSLLIKGLGFSGNNSLVRFVTFRFESVDEDEDVDVNIQV